MVFIYVAVSGFRARMVNGSKNIVTVSDISELRFSNSLATSETNFMPLARTNTTFEKQVRDCSDSAVGGIRLTLLAFSVLQVGISRAHRFERTASTWTVVPMLQLLLDVLKKFAEFEHVHTVPSASGSHRSACVTSAGVLLTDWRWRTLKLCCGNLHVFWAIVRYSMLRQFFLPRQGRILFDPYTPSLRGNLRARDSQFTQRHI